MKKLLLNGAWECAPRTSRDSIPAQVPGSVYADLMAAGGWRTLLADTRMAALALRKRTTYIPDGSTLPGNFSQQTGYCSLRRLGYPV